LAKQVLTYSENLGYARLFADFVHKPERLTTFFRSDPIDKKASSVAEAAKHRNMAFEILIRQNRQWQAPAPVLEAIDKLKDKRAVAVLAGQQACLFGGPYLVILKALAAIKLAQKLESELSIPVVPIFWIAAADHDYREISFVNVYDTSSALSRLAIDVDEGIILR
jgi:uncharacterized protein YllA (UPF0747 family)